MSKNSDKVKAGKKGGRKSTGKFSRRNNRASAAGKISAWARNSGKLEDYPLDFEEMRIPLRRKSRDNHPKVELHE